MEVEGGSLSWELEFESGGGEVELKYEVEVEELKVGGEVRS